MASSLFRNPKALALVAGVPVVAGLGLLLLELVIHEPLGVLPFAISIILVAAVADDVWHDAEERELLIILR